MIQRLRKLVPSLALAALASLVGTGCVLVSGQFLVKLELGDLSITSTAPSSGYHVDLSTNSTYNDHKKDIKSLEDIALVGSVHNTGVSSLTLNVYLVDDNSGASTGTRVWGPLTVAAGATEKLDWDRSSALFGAGKALLLAYIKSGDPFTLHAVGSSAPFTFDFNDAVLIAVIGAGK